MSRTWVGRWEPGLLPTRPPRHRRPTPGYKLARSLAHGLRREDVAARFVGSVTHSPVADLRTSPAVVPDGAAGPLPLLRQHTDEQWEGVPGPRLVS